MNNAVPEERKIYIIQHHVLIYLANAELYVNQFFCFPGKIIRGI